MASRDESGTTRPPGRDSDPSGRASRVLELRRKLRHDLRSPLSIVIGRADLLRSGIQGPLTDEQRHSVEAILAAGERLVREIEAVAEAIDDDGRERSG